MTNFRTKPFGINANSSATNIVAKLIITVQR